MFMRLQDTYKTRLCLVMCLVHCHMISLIGGNETFVTGVTGIACNTSLSEVTI
jgi:hypothetical protein